MYRPWVLQVGDNHLPCVTEILEKNFEILGMQVHERIWWDVYIFSHKKTQTWVNCRYLTFHTICFKERCTKKLWKSEREKQSTIKKKPNKERNKLKVIKVCKVILVILIGGLICVIIYKVSLYTYPEHLQETLPELGNRI